MSIYLGASEGQKRVGCGSWVHEKSSEFESLVIYVKEFGLPSKDNLRI